MEINFPNHDLKPEDETIKRWLADRSLRRLLLIGYFCYELTRLVFTGVAAFVVLRVAYTVIPILPTAAEAVIWISIASVLLVLIIDLRLVKSHRSIISYLSITTVVYVLQGLVYLRNHVYKDELVNEEVISTFSEELLEETPFLQIFLYETSPTNTNVATLEDDQDYPTK